MENLPHSKNRRILIIDDNRAIHDDFRKILSPVNSALNELEVQEAALFGSDPSVILHHQFTIDSAYQGEEGVSLVTKAMAEANPYALAFVDVRMPPGYDGLETTLKMWAIDPEIQIVLCTAYSDYSWDEIYEKIGNHDGLLILKKPFDTVEALQMAYALTEKWWLQRQSLKTMAELERMVEERTDELRHSNDALQIEIIEHQRAERQLSIQNDAFRVLAESSATAQAAPKILQIFGANFAWDIGELWLVDPKGDSIRLVEFWSAPNFSIDEFNTPVREKTLARGLGLPGRVWDSGQPAWIDQIDEAENSYHLHAAKKAGLKGAFAYPILQVNEVIGVIQFFSREVHNPDEYMVRTFAVLGTQLGQFFQRLKLEEQLFQAKKTETISMLAGGIAHHFNNIMAIILGYSELTLSRLPSGNPLIHNMKEISAAAERAAELTRQLLAYSRNQLFQTKLHDLNQIIIRMEGKIHHLLGRDIGLHIISCGDIHAVKVDAGQIEQVIINMVLNARDAMPDGGKLIIKTENIMIDKDCTGKEGELTPGDYVLLTITDTGTGMSAEVMSHLFEAFFTTKEVGQGTGLGLATCYGIIKQSGGLIRVDSEPGQGATFKIYLPRAL